MQYFRPAATVLLQNTMQFKRSVVGIQTQHDRAGKEAFSNNFLSWRKKVERVLEKTAASQGIISVLELELCLGFELLILRYTNQVEILVALPGKTWVLFM